MSQYAHLRQLQGRVGAWSRDNFGQEEVDPLNCWLGIQEELAELSAALGDDDRKDAIADALIFLCDYLTRTGEHLDLLVVLAGAKPDGIECYSPVSITARLNQVLGMGAKHLLKYRQGIRGDSGGHWAKHREALGQFWNECDRYCAKQWGCTAYWLANEVFSNVVSKRNWKANPATGVATA